MTKNSPLKHLFLLFLIVRAKIVASLLNPYIKSQEKILDIGCGNLLISKELVKTKKIEVRGVDVLDMNLTDLPHQVFDGKKIPFPDKHFNSSLLIGVLHHVQDQKSLLNEAKRVSSKIVIFEDIYSNSFERTWIKVRDIIGNLPEELKMNFALNFHSDSDWQYIFASHHLRLAHKQLWWNPYRLTRHAIYVLET